MKQKLLLALCFFTAYTSFAQIQGTVTDKNNKALPFVNIYIENTYTGTTSNTEGYYELNLTKTGTHTVVFQFLGYKTLKKKVDISSFPYTLDAVLIDEEITLNEVVINSE